MSLWVVDASVTVKWLMPASPGEAHVGEALELLYAFRRGDVGLVQPLHWLAECAAVLARVSGPTAQAKVELLQAMNVPLADSAAIWHCAVELAIELDHHLFDTLYHAVALCTPTASLITADRRYYAKAAAKGNITLLGD